MMQSTHPVEMRKIFSDRIPNLASVKTPLIKHGKGITRRGAHYTNVTPSFAHQVGLAHFKFYPGFDAKVSDALKNKQYYDGSIEYKFLNLVLENISDNSLLSNETVKYKGPSSFTQAGIW